MSRNQSAARSSAIDPARTAILLIDTQAGIFHPGAESARPFFFRQARDVAIPNMARLIAAGRKAGAEIDYEYTSDLRTRRKRHSPGKITRLERNVAFEWAMGIRHFFEQVERYELAPHPLGTRLHHRVEFRGMVGFLFRGRPSRASHARMCEADDALRTLLAGKKPSPAKPPARNGRKQRR